MQLRIRQISQIECLFANRGRPPNVLYWTKRPPWRECARSIIHRRRQPEQAVFATVAGGCKPSARLASIDRAGCLQNGQAAKKPPSLWARRSARPEWFGANSRRAVLPLADSGRTVTCSQAIRHRSRLGRPPFPASFAHVASCRGRWYRLDSGPNGESCRPLAKTARSVLRRPPGPRLP